MQERLIQSYGHPIEHLKEYTTLDVTRATNLDSEFVRNELYKCGPVFLYQWIPGVEIELRFKNPSDAAIIKLCLLFN